MEMRGTRGWAAKIKSINVTDHEIQWLVLDVLIRLPSDQMINHRARQSRVRAYWRACQRQHQNWCRIHRGSSTMNI